MKTSRIFFAFTGICLALGLGSISVHAQAAAGGAQAAPGGAGGLGGLRGMRNLDPQQMQQMMGQFFRDQLGITNDDEWKVIEPRLNKVVQSRMQTMMAGFGRGRRGQGQGQGGQGAGGFATALGLGQADPEADALQQAVDADAPVAEINAKLAKLREARKKKADESARNQAALKEVLSLRQEAQLVLTGVLE